ncbi:MAG: rod shape-determining protein [Candidatus Scalindua sp.]|nr:rod shape-determining protein [Candidatus Scalindua sp.]
MAKNQISSESNFIVGIDLGTSRSAIVTENGVKGVVESIVGWPQDIIGVKVLGNSIAIGDTAIEFRELLEISHPLAHGVIKEGVPRDIEAAEELIKHIISLAEVPEKKKICGIIGVPAKASLQSKQILLDLTKKHMHQVTLISEPFAVAYREERLNNSIVIDLGAGTLNFCTMKGRIPDQNNQVSLEKAGNFIDTLLFESLKNKFPDAQLNLNIVKKLKEKHGTIQRGGGKIVAELRMHGKPRVLDITDEMISACSAFVPNMIEEIKKLVISFDPEFQEEAMKNIILAGGMSKVKGYDAVIKEALADFGDAQIHIIDDPVYAVAEGALKIGTDIPVKYWSQLGETAASGK